MPKLSTNLALLEHELSELRLILERQTGVLLNTEPDIISEAVAEMLESRRIGSVKTLLERLQSSDAECESLAERLFDGETAFFRYPAVFEAFAKTALPDLAARKQREHPPSFRLWSAGCSTGEEAYSIALSVCEAVNCNAGPRVHIVASDIRRKALAVAERGLYPQAALERIPRNLVQTYFARVGEHFLAKPRLRNLVNFGPMNLSKPAFLGQFDCIFCVDVLPRFSAAQRAALVERLHLYLQPGGYLFLGQNEKLPASEGKFRPQARDGYTFHQKAIAAAAKSGA